MQIIYSRIRYIFHVFLDRDCGNASNTLTSLVNKKLFLVCIVGAPSRVTASCSSESASLAALRTKNYVSKMKTSRATTDNCNNFSKIVKSIAGSTSKTGGFPPNDPLPDGEIRPITVHGSVSK
jgi:hypothetical protein